MAIIVCAAVIAANRSFQLAAEQDRQRMLADQQRLHDNRGCSCYPQFPNTPEQQYVRNLKRWSDQKL